MSLKKNFHQAFRELLNGQESAGSKLEPEAKLRSNSDAQLEQQQETSGQGTLDSVEKNIDADSVVNPANKDSSASNPTRKIPFMRDVLSHKPSAEPFSPQNGLQQVNETTVISKNTIVIGDIRSLANVTIEGNVRGKVDVLKDATVQGMLVGDLTCKNAKMQGSSLQGNVLTRENAYIDNNSTVLGDMVAQCATIDGKVKGKIEIGSKVQFHENAIISGDIYTSTIIVEDGANIKGFVNTSYLSENEDAAFPSQIVIEEDNLLGIK